MLGQGQVLGGSRTVADVQPFSPRSDQRRQVLEERQSTWSATRNEGENLSHALNEDDDVNDDLGGNANDANDANGGDNPQVSQSLSTRR